MDRIEDRYVKEAKGGSGMTDVDIRKRMDDFLGGAIVDDKAVNTAGGASIDGSGFSKNEIVDRIDIYTEAKLAGSRAIVERGLELFDGHDFKNAVNVFEEALNSYLSQNINRRHEISYTLYMMSISNIALERFRDAEVAGNEALRWFEMAQKAKGTQHKPLSKWMILKALALAYDMVDEPAEAVETMKIALMEMISETGVTNSITAGGYCEYAEYLVETAAYKEAERCLNEGLSIYRSLYEKGEKCINDMAIAYIDHGKVLEKLEKYGKALEIYAWLKQFIIDNGGDNCMLAKVEYLAGKTYHALEDNETALEKYNAAVGLLSGNGQLASSMDAADLLRNIGKALIDLNEIESGSFYIERAAGIYEANVSLDMVYSIKAILHIGGSFYNETGETEKALMMYEKCFKLISICGISDIDLDARLHFESGRALFHLGARESGIKRMEKAVKLYESCSYEKKAASVKKELMLLRHLR